MTTTTRGDHVRWCKQRALEYIEKGDCAGAVASMVSDLAKHPATESLVSFAALIGPANARQGIYETRRFIEGFSEGD